MRGVVILAALAALALSTAHAAETDPMALARARFPELVGLTAARAALLARRAVAGDGNAMATLAEAYEFGFGELPVDGDAAILWMRRAAATGVPGAAKEADFLQFSRDYADLVAGAVDTMANARAAASGTETGPGAEPDPDLLELARLGFPDAQAALAGMYASGRGAGRNLAAAARWYASAAAGGDASADFALGGMFRTGAGVPSDQAAAAARFAAAWEGGISAAAMVLGDMLLTGEAGPPDLDAALEWYAAGASRGDLGARERLAWIQHAHLQGEVSALPTSP